MQGLALLTAERLLPERRLDLVLLRIKASSGFSDGGRDPRALRGRLEPGPLTGNQLDRRRRR